MKRSLKVLAVGLAAAALVVTPAAIVSAQEVDDDSIAAIAVGNPDFSTLVAALGAADLVGAVSDCDGDPLTVFAPTNAAFESALGSLGLTAEEVLADTETLSQILLYHVVAGAVDSGTVVTLDSATTLQGEDVTIAVEGEGVVLNGSVNVTAVDIEACNGVIHVIDSVLVPPTILAALTGGGDAGDDDAVEEALPHTGVNTALVAMVAGLFLVGGAAAVGVTRRRVEV